MLRFDNDRDSESKKIDTIELVNLDNAKIPKFKPGMKMKIVWRRKTICEDVMFPNLCTDPNKPDATFVLCTNDFGKKIETWYAKVFVF